jgi:hypothetical protein
MNFSVGIVSPVFAILEYIFKKSLNFSSFVVVDPFLLFQIPLEIVDVETTGYVLRLCPFESLAFSGNGLTDDDLEGFIVVSFCLISRKLFFSPKSISSIKETVTWVWLWPHSQLKQDHLRLKTTQLKTRPKAQRLTS